MRTDRAQHVSVGGFALSVAVLWAAQILPQSIEKPLATKLKAIPLAPCATFGNPQSCKTFNKMIAAHDTDFTDLREPPFGTTYICFRPTIDSFFRVDFESFGKEWYRGSPLADAPLEDWLTFSSYLEGQDNVSYLRLLKWYWVKGTPNTAEATPNGDAKDQYGIQDADLTEASIHIAVVFQNTKNENVKETIDIRRSTGRFTMDTSRGSENDHETGTCVRYP
jgi:hypothetical protein